MQLRYAEYGACDLSFSFYDNGAVAIQLTGAEGSPYEGEPIATATINPTSPLALDEVAVPTYKLRGMVEALQEGGVAAAPHRTVPAGYATIPVLRLTSAALAEVSKVRAAIKAAADGGHGHPFFTPSFLATLAGRGLDAPADPPPAWDTGADDGFGGLGVPFRQEDPEAENCACGGCPECGTCVNECDCEDADDVLDPPDLDEADRVCPTCLDPDCSRPAGHQLDD